MLRRFESRCRVIHFPIDALPYVDAPPLWDELLPQSWQSEPLVLFVGRLVSYKGVDVLLDALRLTERARLAIVGVGPLGLGSSSKRLGSASRSE